MQTQNLYPELTTDEVELIIGPLTMTESSDDDDEGLFTSVQQIELPVEAFGPSNERYSFERVSRHVAHAVHERYWDPRDDEALYEPEEFAAGLREVLASDVLEFAIRPLADSVEPVAEVDDALTYQHFCQALIGNGLSDFARTFPALWQRLGVRLRQRVYAVGEAVQRIRGDRALLAETFGIDASVKIKALSLAGDTHGGGRNVSVVEFHDGSKVVYKPRPVDCEAGYSGLVDFLNSEFGCDFNAASVLPRTDYGYVEFIESDPDAEADVFRGGQLAALLYAINARDMHFTNILSTPKGPVPIDLETLLHPHRQKSIGTIEPDTSGYKRLAASVFGTGVLPVVLTHQDRDGYIDVGYLGGGEVGGSGPFRHFRLENPFSARVRVSWAPDESPAREPDAAVEAASRAVRQSCSRMVDGFTETYELIRSRKDEFIAAVERHFARAEIRYIHNATVQYLKCLRMLTGTAVSADVGLARGLVKRIGIASRGGDNRLVNSECRQLWSSDVPYFLVRADRCDITDGSSARSEVARIESTPMEQFRAKMDELSDTDLTAQLRLIRVAFNGKLPDPHVMTPAAEVLGPVPGGESSPGAIRDLAAEIGDELVTDMVQDRYEHLPQTWIGPVATEAANRPWPPGVLGYDLYTGRVGPALALAGLARVLDEPRFAAASMKVFGPAQKILSEESYEARSITHAGNGAYNGFSGALWTLACAGWLLDEPELIRTAQRSVGLLKQSEPGVNDEWYDLISGDVGATLIGISLGDGALLPDAIIGCQRALDSGWAQRTEYSGLAHGLAGGLHLAGRAHQVTPDPASAKLVADIEAELDTVFRSRSGELRTNRTGEERYSDSWCNGTAGVLVGMSSAVSAGLLDPDVLHSTIGTIPEGLMATSCTLCHGALGMYEVLGQMPSDSVSRPLDIRAQLGNYLSVDRLRSFLDSPDSRYSQGPCLMVGRAGVAWHLLTRLTEESLPSPLTLGGVNLDG